MNATYDLPDAECVQANDEQLSLLLVPLPLPLRASASLTRPIFVSVLLMFVCVLIHLLSDYFTLRLFYSF